jgi:hypothetical protein
MKLPEHYEKWVEDQAFASHSFRYVEDAFESGAEAMYRKLMEDFAPAIEALKFYADRRNWDKTIIAKGSTITTSEWADKLIVTDCALLNCGGGRARLARDYLKEKGLLE